MKIRFKKAFAFWIWKNLSGGKVPFYNSEKLQRHRTHFEPTASAWFGWKLKIWQSAVDYLKSTGDLTYTPTLPEDF